MNRWNRFSGILGLVLLFFGLIGSFVAGALREPSILLEQPLIAAHLVVGLALILYWFFSSGVRNMNAAGEAIRGRSVRFGTNAIAYGIIFIGILGVINYFAARHNKRWDVTEAGVFSLASQSKGVLQALKQPLRLVALTNVEGGNDEETRNLLGLYHYNNPSKVTTEFVDPGSTPNLIDVYGFKQGNLLYLEYGQGEKKSVSRINELSEEAITNAILKLERGEAKKIYYIEGHQEPGRTDEKPTGASHLMASLEDEHLTVEGLLLGQKGAVPDDAAAVILASPKRSLLPEERDSLVKYVEGGGHLLILADPRGPAEVKEIAAHFGLKIGDNVVIDQIQRLFAGPTLGAQPMAQQYGSHPITNGLREQDVTIYNIASSVTPTEKNTDSTKYTELVKSSPTAWGETSLDLLFSEEPSATLDKEDLVGPISLAAAYEKKIEASPKQGEQASDQKEARVVVFGDSDWVLNANLNVYANRDLFIRSINWLSGEATSVSIQARSLRESTQPIPESKVLLILATSFLVPELILVAGLLIWWRRRTVLA